MVDAVVPDVGCAGVDDVFGVVAVVHRQGARAGHRHTVVGGGGVGHGGAFGGVVVFVLVEVVVVGAVVVEAVVPGVGGVGVVRGVVFDTVVAGQAARAGQDVVGVGDERLVGDEAHVGIEHVAVFVDVVVVASVAVLVDAVAPGVGGVAVDSSLFVVAVGVGQRAGAADGVGAGRAGALVGGGVGRAVPGVAVFIGVEVVALVAVVVDAVVPDVGGPGVDHVFGVVAVVDRQEPRARDVSGLIGGGAVRGGVGVVGVPVFVGVEVVLLVAVHVDAVVPDLAFGGAHRGGGVVAVVGGERRGHPHRAAVHGVAVGRGLDLGGVAVGVGVVVVVVGAVVVVAVVPGVGGRGIVRRTVVEGVVVAVVGRQCARGGVLEVVAVGGTGRCGVGLQPRVGVGDVAVVVLVVVVFTVAVGVFAVVPDLLGLQPGVDGGVGVVAVGVAGVEEADGVPVVVGLAGLALGDRGGRIGGVIVAVVVEVDVATAVLVGAVVQGVAGVRVDLGGLEAAGIDEAPGADVDVGVVVAQRLAQHEEVALGGGAVGAAVHAVGPGHDGAGVGVGVPLVHRRLAVAVPVVLVVDRVVAGAVLVHAVVGTVGGRGVDVGGGEAARGEQDGERVGVVGVALCIEGADVFAHVGGRRGVRVVPAVVEDHPVEVDRGVHVGHERLVVCAPVAVAVGVAVGVGHAGEHGGAVVVHPVVKDLGHRGIGLGRAVFVVAVARDVDVVAAHAGVGHVGAIGHRGAVAVEVAVREDLVHFEAGVVDPRAVLVGAVVPELLGARVDVGGGEVGEVGVGVVVGVEVDAVCSRGTRLVGGLVGALPVAVLVEVVVAAAVLVGAVVPGVVLVGVHHGGGDLLTRDVGVDLPAGVVGGVVGEVWVVPAVADAHVVRAGVRDPDGLFAEVLFRGDVPVAVEVEVVVAGAVGVDAVVGVVGRAREDLVAAEVRAGGALGGVPAVAVCQRHAIAVAVRALPGLEAADPEQGDEDGRVQQAARHAVSSDSPPRVDLVCPPAGEKGRSVPVETVGINPPPRDAPNSAECPVLRHLGRVGAPAAARLGRRATGARGIRGSRSVGARALSCRGRRPCRWHPSGSSWRCARRSPPPRRRRSRRR